MNFEGRLAVIIALVVLATFVPAIVFGVTSGHWNMFMEQLGGYAVLGLAGLAFWWLADAD